MDIIAVWLTDMVFFFSARLWLHTACKPQANFIVLIPLLSVTDTICLHFHFLVSRPGMGGM
jgi:hypothetical protein